MSMLFKDDLADQGKRIMQFFPERFGVKLTWLRGLTGALAELGLSMQACMTAPTEILASVQGMDAITNARVSGDGGISLTSAQMGSLLTSMVGIGWSKDNIRTTAKAVGNEHPHAQYGDGTRELGMLMATLSLGPVGITDPLSETVLPGPWDAPVWPANTTITSNVSIVKAAISLNGSLLQPSYPITPSAATLTAESSSQTRAVWATYTSVPCSGAGSTSATCNHFTVVVFLDTCKFTTRGSSCIFDRGKCKWVSHADKVSGHNFKKLNNQSREQCCAACFALPLQCEAFVRDPVAETCFLITGVTSNATRKSSDREIGFTNRKLPPPPPPQELWPARDLLPLADRHAKHVAPFAQPPASFFVGSGTELQLHEYVHSPNEPIAPQAGAGTVGAGQGIQPHCAAWVAAGTPIPLDHVTDSKHGGPAQQINLSPRLTGSRVILLGEAHKFAAVSTYRFGSIAVSSAHGLSIVLRGNAGERVALRFVRVSADGVLGVCEAKVFKLIRNGATTVQLP